MYRLMQMFGTALLWLGTLLACVLLVLGLYSFRRGLPANSIWITPEQKQPQTQFALVRGVLHIVHARPPRLGLDRDTQFGGFYFRRLIYQHTEALGGGVPIWYPLGACMSAPVWLLVRGPVRRQRRRRRHECEQCGYSLVGLTAPRCPECGRGFPEAALQKAAAAELRSVGSK